MPRPSQELPMYSIGAVEELTGLTGRQIRYYEKMGLINPERTSGNQRLYSPAIVERLKEIKRLLSSGMKLAGIKALLQKEDEKGGPVEGPKRVPERTEPEKERDIDFRTSSLTSVFPVREHYALINRLEKTERP